MDRISGVGDAVFLDRATPETLPEGSERAGLLPWEPGKLTLFEAPPGPVSASGSMVMMLLLLLLFFFFFFWVA